MAPNHTHGARAFSGISFTVAMAPVTMNSGTHSHVWKLKLPAKTTTAETAAMAA